MNTIDLHVHSNRSDGSFTPTELVDYAMEKGLTAFALTDHDTVEGLSEALSYAEKLREEGRQGVPEVIPGIELSTEYQGRDVHMVGLYIDASQGDFQEYLKQFIDSRTERNVKMCRLLQQAGMDITYEELIETYPGAVITRSHYGRLLLKKGYVKSVKEAFERYIGDHAPCFLPREKVTPAQAIQLIRAAGGIPVLAHPILYGLSDTRLDQLTKELTEDGLVGIEAIYSTYSPADERQIRRLAAKYHLLLSGGSDFHGVSKPDIDLGSGRGRLFIHPDVLRDIRSYHEQTLACTQKA